MARETLADRLRGHFGHRDHLYGVLLAEMAEDWDAGGVSREVFRGWEDADARQFPQLRLLAGLFRIVLRGDAPQLRCFYPCLGGDADPRGAWEVVRPVLAEHLCELRASLTQAPQTNEPARTVALLVGLAQALRRTGLHRVRLLEPGASAGLGLLLDRYRFLGEGWSAGPKDSPLTIEGCGAAGLVPEPFEVVARRGCDLAPVVAGSTEGSIRLRSFVWPWMLERHARLDGALALARTVPVAVDRAGAAQWLERRLAEPVPPEVLTVVWHSVTRMYWPLEETRAVSAAVEAARARMPVAHITMENPWPDGASRPSIEDGTLPRIELDGVVLGTCGHHGPPVHLLAS